MMVKKPRQAAKIPKKGFTSTKKLLLWVRWVFVFVVGIDMQIKVHYGSGFIDLQVPDRNISQIIQSWQGSGPQDSTAILRSALAGDAASGFKAESAGKDICVLLADSSRKVPFDTVFAELPGLLGGTSSVQFIICTGTHESQIPANNEIVTKLNASAEAAGLGDFHIHIHDCRKDAFAVAGTTSRGSEVIYNKLVDKAQMFLVVSDVKSHYFAGYSNPVKNFLPGICAFKTVEQNHSFTLNDKSRFGAHPWHPDESRTNNPLAADMVEGMEMIAAGRSVYALVTISGPGGISWSQFGLARQVSAESFLEADKHNMHKVAPTERLIVSPGGEPNDIDLYIAQRALELTKQAVKDDGEILFIAACPGGMGQKHTMENFYNRLTEPIDDILGADRSEYKLFSHKPYRFAELIKRMRRIHVYSEMPAELVKAAHLCPIDDPQAVVDGWISQNPAAKITIVDGANKIALLGN